MGKTKFVDNQLIKIRDKLPSEALQTSESLPTTAKHSENTNELTSPSDKKTKENKPEKDLVPKSTNKVHDASYTKTQKKQTNSVSANEKEWKKAIFKRWDDFKNLKTDILQRLAELNATIPSEIKKHEEKFNELHKSLEKISILQDKVKNIDDSDWNRHNFSNELGIAMRELEKSRIEFMMIQAKITAQESHNSKQSVSSNSSNFIHELSSLTFSQCFRLGLGFFMPLIIAVIFATILWGGIYFLSIH
jgi:hypothetical protein